MAAVSGRSQVYRVLGITSSRHCIKKMKKQSPKERSASPSIPQPAGGLDPKAVLRPVWLFDVPGSGSLDSKP